jgi:tetraacyldisaccharide 4'-kinase
MRPPDFWYGAGFSPWPALLGPAALAYDAAARLERALATPKAVPAPVLCVGNLVAGGAGKTPTALAIAELLIKHGAAVHFLTRGYGRSATAPERVESYHRADDVGDEALLLARTAPTWVGADRRITAIRAVSEGASVLVMDDGFQNPELAKDLSLIVVDGEVGFGNGRILPAGPLRERPARALRRAQGVLIIGDDRTGVGPWLLGLAARALPLFHARLVPADSAQALRGRRLFAFSGIARPAKFFTSLREGGCDVVGTKAFPDHHRFRSGELDGLRARARAAGATLVTTEKDRVRLSDDDAKGIAVFAVALAWRDPRAVEAWLAPLLAKAKSRGA